MERLIKPVNPQPEVRKNAESAPDWQYQDQARYLYGRAQLFRERLIDPIARIDRSQMPDPVISFDNLRNYRTLAAYRLTRNPNGLNYEIIMNTQHYTDVEGRKTWEYGEWALNETFVHELCHEWQQTTGKDPIQLGNIYHNQEFVDKCEGIGLHPKLGEGYHLRLADGPFGILMNELGIKAPEELKDTPGEFNLDWFRWLLDFQGKSRRGTSSLTRWTCPGCGLNVRMGIKGDPELTHDPCGVRLVRR